MAIVQLPHVPQVPIKYWPCGLFQPCAILDELSNWVTFTYGQMRYVYCGRSKSEPQRHSPRNACTAAGPKRVSVMHTGSRDDDTVAVDDAVEVADEVDDIDGALVRDAVEE